MEALFEYLTYMGHALFISLLATVIGTVTIILVSMIVILAAWHSDNLSFRSKLFVSASLSASVIVNLLGVYKYITAAAV